MDKALFSITCTTCRARLAVRNAEAVGAILSCPKCGSMVLAEPPQGWTPPSPGDDGGTVEDAVAQPAVSAPPEPSSPHPRESAETLAALESCSVLVVATLSPESVETCSSAAAAAGAPEGEPPTLVPGGDGRPSDAVPLPNESAPLRPAPSTAELLWRGWLTWGMVPVVAAVLVLGIASLFRSSGPPEVPPEPIAQASPESSQSPQAVEPAAGPRRESAGFPRRWLPDATSLVFRLGAAKFARQPNATVVLERSGPCWQQTIGRLTQSLGLKLEDIDRATWASTELAQWTTRGVAVLELAEGKNTDALASLGEPVDIVLAGQTCRRVPKADWPHPFAVVDKRTVVAGDSDLLRGLAQRSEIRFTSGAMQRMLDGTAADAEATLLVDLGAARADRWGLPGTLFDIWPSGTQAWHELCEIPQGLGCTFRYASPLRVEAALICDSETSADKVNNALGTLIPAARQTLGAQRGLVQQKLQSGTLNAATAGRYESFLGEALTAANGARWELAGDTVWVRMDFTQGPTELALLTLDSRSAVATDWLATALVADNAKLAYLMAGLAGLRKAEGCFPEGAKGSSLLAPETRLSWLASMLPYYGHGEWYRDLQTGYSWNSPQNRAVTSRPLPEAVNPALGPSKTEAGFPVTHYVGVGGVGADAGRLGARDPRAGVFGYGRTTRPEDIADGASNTIAVLGASDHLGAWAAGGDATVRPLTKAPYVNGTDGFGSGQPDGMLAGMADGSVRFLAKNVDSRVLEQMATINGGEHGPALAVNARPALPGPQPFDPAAAPGPAVPAAIPTPAADPGPAAADRPPAGAVPVDVTDDEPQDEPADSADEPAPAGDAAKGAAPQSAAPPVDVRVRLAERIPRFNLPDVPMIEALELVGTLGTLPISLDPDALEQLGFTPRDPVRLSLTGATLGEILEAIAASRGLLPVVEDGQVLVTTPPAQRTTLQQVRYTVSDLTRGDEAAMADLADMVETLVAPETWRRHGGRGTMANDGTALVVDQTMPVHYQVLNFCEKLRNARGVPLRSRGNHERFDLCTRRQRAISILQRPVTVNFHDPAPLGEILAYLEGVTGATLLVDRAALEAAGLSERSPGTITVEKQPAAIALENLLRPMGLLYRVVDAQTMQITTFKSVLDRLELEFHPVGPALKDGRSGPDLVQYIKGRVAGSTWSDAGGPGVIRFDAPSKCLIVLQSQQVQVAVEQLLAAPRGK